MTTALIIIGVILIIAFCVILVISHDYKDEKIPAVNPVNPYIVTDGKPLVAAHRSGAGIAPENTMLAFRNCVNSNCFNTNLFEFDLHITKDNQLILLHDDTFDRTSNSIEQFGQKGIMPFQKTYDELYELNMGENFKDSDGKMPYKGLRGKDIPDDLHVLRLQDLFSFLAPMNKFGYIIEIKNGKELGKKAADILYNTLKKFNLLSCAFVGTFHREITEYMEQKYPDMLRSASKPEALDIYFSSLFGIKHKDDYYKFSFLHIPYKDYVFNFGTTRFMNYAHRYNIAVQFWTINKEEDIKHLQLNGADAIMSDLPDFAFDVINDIK